MSLALNLKGNLEMVFESLEGNVTTDAWKFMHNFQASKHTPMKLPDRWYAEVNIALFNPFA